MNKHVTLSVVIPVYNSAQDLKQCLAALAKSEYRDFDVLVVDDGSTEAIKPLVDEHMYGYVRIDGPSGPARARNHGVSMVSGRFVVFVDADVCVHPETLKRFADAFAVDPTIGAVIGSYDDAPAIPNFVSKYKNLSHHYFHQHSDGEITTFWTGCGAMRRDLFLSFGGFDETRYRRPSIEDIELGTWVSAAGNKIILDSRIKGKHLKRWTLWNLLKTDIFDRGIPWTRLMLRAGALANTLNVKPTQRLTIALSYLTMLFIVSSFWLPLLGLIALGLAVTVTLLNLDYYRFFLRRTGLWFTLRVIPLHWLYFWYCGFSFAWGSIQHYWAGDKSGIPRLQPRPDATSG